MRILIAEDDYSSRLVLEAAVAHLGHSFVSSADGKDAWRLFQETSVDVVVSDRSMPGIDGLELCRRIRADTTPGYAYFIFVTSRGDKAGILQGLEAGADDYLAKPLDLDDLSARLIVAARVTELHRKIRTQQLELSRLNRDLFEQARTDPLTSLGTRLKLAEDIERLYAGSIGIRRAIAQ